MRKEREKQARSYERTDRPAYLPLVANAQFGQYAHALNLNDDEDYFFEVEDF